MIQDVVKNLHDSSGKTANLGEGAEAVKPCGNYVDLVIGVMKICGKLVFACAEWEIALSKGVLRMKKIVAKTVPGVSVAISSVQAYRRFQQGQFWRGVGEIASGLSCCVPGYGMIVSLGLDAIMMSIDFKESRRPSICQKIVEVFPVDLPGAYQVLGIEPNPDHTLDRREVDQAFLLLNRIVHPAGVVDVDPLQGLANECAPALMHAREVIYQKRGWV